MSLTLSSSNKLSFCITIVRIRNYSDPHFSTLRTEYGEILRISPYSVRIWKNSDQINSEYGHFLCSVGFRNEGEESVRKFLKSYVKTQFFYKTWRNNKIETVKERDAGKAFSILYALHLMSMEK